MIKKLLFSFLFSAAATAILIPGMALNADSSVEINKTNFPDANFRTFVSKSFDKDKDGKLSLAEIKAVDEISCSSEKIKSFKGIEFFTDVETIDCFDNEISELDLSKNTKLKKLRCSDNEIDELDLSGTPELTELDCGSNDLTSLNLAKNTKLEDLKCDYNELLDNLDISKNTKLTYLDCYDCDLHSLDLKNNPKLDTLIAGHNYLTSIDLSGLTKLDTACLNENKLKTLDIVDCVELRELDVSCNNIDYLDISKCKKLIEAFSAGGDRDFYQKGVTVYNKIDWDSSGDAKPFSPKLVVDNKTMITKEVVMLSGEKTVSLKLPCGSGAKIYVKGAEGSTDIIWSSSDSSLVTVNKNGFVKAVKGGSATVTATLDGKKYKCKVSSLYKDVTDSSKFWYTPTYALTDMGVVKGYDNQTNFKPANKCTRAQMVTFIWRLMGSPEPKSKECSFSDVYSTDYFYKACIWGNENHIVEGYKDGTFGPQIVCARRHAVTFLWRLAGKPEPNIDKIKFTDVFKDINEDDYFYEACLWASEKKIVAGYDDNTFRPNGDCLRRQMVTFLYKYDKYVKNK